MPIIHVIAHYVIFVSTTEIDNLKRHNTTNNTDVEIAADLAKASIEAHKEQPTLMEMTA